MTNADQPAFPIVAYPGQPDQQTFSGMSKREYFAAIAMQNLLTSQIVADRDRRYDQTNWKQVVAMNAIEFADELLRQLETPK